MNDIDLTDNEFLKKNMKLVKITAHRLASRMPANIEVDDLVQLGLIGLLDARKRFDPQKGYQFDTFAGKRILGSMLDFLRKTDTVSRKTRVSIKSISKARSNLHQELGRRPLDSEVALKLDMPLETFQDGDMLDYSSKVVHLEDLSHDDNDEDFLDRNTVSEELNPESIFQQEQLKEKLSQIIAGLTEREQQLFELYYVQDITQVEIGQVIKASASRVNQRLKALNSKIKIRLEAYIFPTKILFTPEIIPEEPKVQPRVEKVFHDTNAPVSLFDTWCLENVKSFNLETLLN